MKRLRTTYLFGTLLSLILQSALGILLALYLLTSEQWVFKPGMLNYVYYGAAYSIIIGGTNTGATLLMYIYLAIRYGKITTEDIEDMIEVFDILDLNDDDDYES